MAGISLVNAGLPPDVQAQLLQQQQVQDLALALMAQSQTPGSPITHTGGANPFARDVVNLDSLGRLGQAYFGKQHANEATQAQVDILSKLMAARQATLESAFAPSMQPGGPPTSMGTVPPSAMDVMQRTVTSQDPYIAGLAQTIMAKLAQGAEARQVKPGDVAGLTRYNLPQSIHTTPDWFGFNQLSPTDINALQPKPQIESVPPGNRLEAVNLPAAAGQPQPGAPSGTQAVTNLLPQVQPKLVNIGGSNAVQQPSGQIDVLPTAQTAANKEQLTGLQERAQSELEDIHQFNSLVPMYGMMAKIVQRGQTTGNFGFMGNEINDIRKMAVAAGVSEDKANRITDFETFKKFSVPEAAGQARKGVGARVSNIEWNSFLESLGASGSVDTRAMQRIMQQNLLAGINRSVMYNKYTLPQYSKSPGADPQQLEALKTGITDPMDVARTMNKTYGIPTNWSIDPQGFWINQNILNPSPQPAAPGLMQQIMSGP